MHLSIETPPPPPPFSIPGLCGAMLVFLLVFEVMVSPRGWGISEDLLSVFIWQSGNEVGIWLVPSFLTVISSRDHRYFDVSGFEFKFPNRWFSRNAIFAMLVDGVNKRSLISWLCLSTSICSFHHGYLCLPRLHENHLLFGSVHPVLWLPDAYRYPRYIIFVSWSVIIFAFLL